MRQIPAKAKGAIALAASGVFAAALLLEPIHCSRRDDMQSFGSVFTKEKASTQKEVLGKVQNAKTAAQASQAVFSFLKGNAPKEQKYAVVDAFSAKFKDAALKEFSAKAHVDFGFEFNGGIEQFKKGDPNALSYMQALTHGFFSFGPAGLDQIISLISMQPGPSPFAMKRERSSPLTTQIGLMVCAKLKKYGKMDADAASKQIISQLSRKDITETAKRSLLGMLDSINPGALNSLKGNPEISPQLKELITELQKKPEPE